MSFWSRGTLAYNSIARAADLLASARAHKYEQISREIAEYFTARRAVMAIGCSCFQRQR